MIEAQQIADLTQRVEVLEDRADANASIREKLEYRVGILTRALEYTSRLTSCCIEEMKGGSP